jgi:hypothetical protein
MRRLLIDDFRTFPMIFHDECWDLEYNSEYYPDMIKDPNNYFQETKNFDRGQAELKYHGPWDELYLDNDLGGGKGHAGIDIMDWMGWPENRCMIPKSIILVSSNPVAVKQMLSMHESWKRNGFIPEDYQIYTRGV